MKIITYQRLTIVFILICTLSFGQEIEKEKADVIKKELDLMFAKSLRAGENLNIEELKNSVCDDYNSGFIIAGKYYDTFDSLMVNFETGIKNIINQEYDVKKKKITILSENTAMITAWGNTKMNVNTGESFRVRFAWTFIYKRIKGQWKIIHSHQSNLK